MRSSSQLMPARVAASAKRALIPPGSAALRTRMAGVDIGHQQAGAGMPVLNPEPIPLNVKVILLGNLGNRYLGCTPLGERYACIQAWSPVALKRSLKNNRIHASEMLMVGKRMWKVMFAPN